MMDRIIANIDKRIGVKADFNDTEIEAIVLDFFRNHPNPDDPDVHELAGKLNLEPEALEKVIYRVFTRYIQNCKG